ncbi:MAG: sigma-70 family RNA polymerase sigma factor [Planctomycetes bacterium]|nr:sigma-70 family RNA polymerase sigma factor [Planctomycetota bacterium]
MEHETLDDSQLVTRAQEGDRAAFGALVERYQERVLNLCYRRLNDRDLALDATQEAFLKAYRGLSRFRAESRFYTWLFRIAVNEATTAHRRRSRRRAGSLDAEGSEGERVPEPAADESYDPQAEASRGDERSVLMEAIAGLEEEQARVVILRDVEQLSYQEVADVLEIPLGSVKSRLHRARNALKTRLLQRDAVRQETRA